MFTLVEGAGALHLGDDVHELVPGDSAVIPTGDLHWLVAGPDGAAIVVTMVPRTTLIREADGSR